jgi:secreted protein with Ig-like and vWFA domain
MTGTRWDHAVSETTIALSLLTPEWQFGIVTYACTSDQFNAALVEADPANVQAAITWIARKFPAGGTGTGPAQAKAFGLADGGVEGTATCWLLSDGQPNCGAAGTTGHKAVALAANERGHVLNTVGIGDHGVFAAFMKELAAATGGLYVHVQ